MKRSGFTLIELMIVVAIIAIISAIAIPNLMEAQMVTKEVSAGTMLQKLAEAESLYRNRNVPKTYTSQLSAMTEFGNNSTNFIGVDVVLAATSIAAPQARSGYFIIELSVSNMLGHTTAYDGDTQAEWEADHFVFVAIPERWNRDGTRIFYIDDNESVYKSTDQWASDNLLDEDSTYGSFSSTSTILSPAATDLSGTQPTWVTAGN
jgi:prepilin-type N-terminal cleavage/methylation domain-containing protein